LTEAAGIVVGVVIEGANRHDCKLMRGTLESIEARRRTAPEEQGLCMDAAYDDAAYDSDEVRRIAQEFGYTTRMRRRGEETKAREAGKKVRRWVVERTYSWPDRYRRLLGIIRIGS
jgi:hypothetical protein